ncbi:hypothetical protein QFZ82_003984 [Streptomyces sp. V4I23]|nr:hypothetical protein [Streptomyces sp. V4I23]MDQ1009499.1 hypothetical protein [Streptomyces sp. V4I23]
MRTSGLLYEHMADVILGTLKALGYEAEHSDDEYRVYAVRVLAGPS